MAQLNFRITELSIRYTQTSQSELGADKSSEIDTSNDIKEHPSHVRNFNMSDEIHDMIEGQRLKAFINIAHDTKE